MSIETVTGDVAGLDAELTPAVVTGEPQAQGDLFIRPWPETTASRQRLADVAKARPVGPKGISVVEGQGGNVHLLVDPDSAGVLWGPYPDGSQTVGVVVVPAGAVAFLDHAEHGRNAIGAGVYVIRRQREQRDLTELVAD